MSRIAIDGAFSLLLFAGSIYLWFAADDFQKFARYAGIDSDFWPKILLAVVAVIALVQLLQQFFTYLATREVRNVRTDDGEASVVNWRKLGGAAVLILGYFVGLQTIGFILATVIFLLLATRLIGYGNWRIALIYPFVFTGLVTLVFVKVLSMPLPRGAGIFETFSRLIY
ncbi:tripartite tricarboxylate transporter TctB family protein [Pseudazoarcus pumilus]|nr:tripartite tricarboxylate transporter TctB family protein [Pseudazoarcus pumilus]